MTTPGQGQSDKDGTGPGPLPGPLIKTLGHQFTDPALLARALTHASAITDRAQSNERLEFVGDRVLGLIVARMLFETFPHEPEGKLGYRFSALVRRETLARVAAGIGLGKHLVLSAAEEEAGGRENDSILADALEAVIAALFLDGGLAAAEGFIDDRWRALLAEDPTPPKDAKTLLQEWAQAAGRPVPDYAIVAQEGPDHAPTFTVEVTVVGVAPERAQGGSKQAAEQAAAAALLKAAEAGS